MLHKGGWAVSLQMPLLIGYYVYHKFTLLVSIWVLLPAVSVYSAVTPWLVYTFPTSFTYGEAMIISQGLTIMLGDTLLQLLKLVCTMLF